MSQINHVYSSYLFGVFILLVSCEKQTQDPSQDIMQFDEGLSAKIDQSRPTISDQDPVRFDLLMEEIEDGGLLDDEVKDMHHDSDLIDVEMIDTDVIDMDVIDMDLIDTNVIDAAVIDMTLDQDDMDIDQDLNEMDAMTLIDECLHNNGGCHINADCQTREGLVVCECSEGFEGDGVHCTPIPSPVVDYTTYQRQSGERFTPLPSSIPLPVDQCAQSQQRWEGDRQNCMVPANTCVIIEDGHQVSCEGEVMIQGTLWIQSDSNVTQTLLIADSIMVMEEGTFVISSSNPNEPGAHSAEVFLRHEYCGLPGDGFSYSAPNQEACLSKGRLTSHGITKIRGQAKTSWSLLTQDSSDTHTESPGLIRVDECTGWQVGDEIVVSATGGDAHMYAGGQGATFCLLYTSPSPRD